MQVQRSSEAPLWDPASAATRLSDVLERLDAGSGETDGIFCDVFTAWARADVAGLGGRALTPVSGALVSVKALLDVEGVVTHGGTRFLTDAPAARRDAPAVARLRAAGAIILGYTNMSELAYSGLGLNPHYGTADNPLWPGHAPGGSSSGGAVSVARGLCDIAIGSDTGGSLRIPAAFCGITGFKPTQSSVPRAGSLVLSDSLDTLGPMARDVAGCEAAWRIMAERPEAEDAAPLDLHISTQFGFDDLTPTVAEGFRAAVSRLESADFRISQGDLSFLEAYHEIPPWHLTSVECRAHHEDAFRTRPDAFDPRVLSRMARADEITAVAYRQTVNRRMFFAEDMSAALAGRALLLPTTPILPPSREALKDDAEFGRMNLLALRNPSLANVGDGCSIALPFEAGGMRLSLMLIAARGADEALLATARAVEAALRASDRPQHPLIRPARS